MGFFRGWLVRGFFYVNGVLFKLILQTAKTICCHSAEMFHLMMLTSSILFLEMGWRGAEEEGKEEEGTCNTNNLE